MKTLIATALAITALFTATAHALIVSGQNGYTVTAYGNPFTGSTNSIAGTGGTVTQPGPIANVVSQLDGVGGSTGQSGRLQSTNGATSGTMQFVAQNPFPAGTVITYQNVNANFNSPMSYNIQLDGNPVQSGPGTPGTSPIAVTTLASKQTVQTLMVNEAMSTYPGQGATTFADMNEVLILPDRLSVVASTASSTGLLTGSNAGLDDLQGGFGGYWIGGSGSSATLTFSGTKRISALVMMNLENQPSSGPLTFDILNDTNTIVANVSMIETGAVGEFVGIDFNTPVTTSFLKFNFTNPGNSGIVEFIPLEAPEPASLGLLMAGGLALLKRRR